MTINLFAAHDLIMTWAVDHHLYVECNGPLGDRVEEWGGMVMSYCISPMPGHYDEDDDVIFDLSDQGNIHCWEYNLDGVSEEFESVIDGMTHRLALLFGATSIKQQMFGMINNALTGVDLDAELRDLNEGAS